jgi:hypothetical protein
MSQSITACQRCGAAVGEGMHYCPGCGRRLAPSSRIRYGTVVAVAAVLFGASFGLKSALHWKRGDVKPTEHIPVAQEEPAVDPELAALRSDLERSPQDLGTLRAMAAVLGSKIRNRPDAAPPLVFETIDILSRILAIAPEDPDALLMIGDVSFDQKAFTKAVEFYERYMKLAPNDLGVTARYASTLTFLGRYDESIKQLEGVLSRDPNNFPAMAYLAITFAQKGELSKARDLGAKALQLAPSEEARARFTGFVESLSTEEGKAVVERAQSSGSQKSEDAHVPIAKGVEGFAATLRANPVAGPKFVRYDDSSPGVLKLVFKDFPMAQMPPFAKEKFFSTLRSSVAAAELTAITTLVFVDEGSGQEMERLGL